MVAELKKVAASFALEATWREKATYDEHLVEKYLQPLEDASRTHGTVSKSLQRSVLDGLHWYFTIDMLERSPTVIVDEPLAIRFHEVVRKTMAHIAVANVEDLDPQVVGPEVKHALWSYHGPQAHGPAAIDAYDHDQRLVRLTYYVHGSPPTETFLADGQAVAPAYGKYRGIWFFRRMLLRQRIAWIPVSGVRTLEILLDGARQEIGLGPSEFRSAHIQASATSILAAAREMYPRGKGGRKPLPGGLAGLKAAALRWLATCTPVRKIFGGAWVFVDRDENADDSAEHLCRWVKRHHPEIRTWFLLDRRSNDWGRLSAEGFRLVTPGLRRKLLLLNTSHIISSHAEYEHAGFDRAIYGDLMRWRYSFVPHGITKDDVSHWLRGKAFDLFATSSPDEHRAIVKDDSPYEFTEREVRCIGLPRRDRLLRIAKATLANEIRVLTVMPTWRGSLVDERAQTKDPTELRRRFAASEYVRHWREVFRSAALSDLLNMHKIELVLLPHQNAKPFVDAFDVPPSVRVVDTSVSGFQPLLCRTIALVTDYSSVAFEMAFLRRAVFYYQFDRQQFYGGDHNWRPGYFDYDEDGFGPVAFTQTDLIAEIERFLQRGARPDPIYIRRMVRANPEPDEQACQRAFESIQQIDYPSTPAQPSSV